MRVRLVGALAIATVGCDAPDRSAPPRAPALDYEALSDARLLSRISLDLRGRRPAEDDLAAVEAGAREIEDLVTDYLHSNAFEARVRAWFGPTYRTGPGTIPIGDFSFPLSTSQQARLLDDAGQEPLRLLGEIARADLPVHDLVTADWTMANAVLGDVLWVDYPAGEGGWEVVSYRDGRPAAGVLSTTGMWWRYGSSDPNANRHRANAIGRILLCDDLLEAAWDFDPVGRGGDFEQRTRDDPDCLACHGALDPIASFLYGFTWYAGGGEDVARYHPERERQWVDRTGVAPAFFGQRGDTIADLGASIASDSRFADCFIDRVGSALHGWPDGEAGFDPDSLANHRGRMADGGWTVRALARSVIDSPAYRAGADGLLEANPAKFVPPDLLGSAVAALTGYEWTRRGAAALADGRTGYAAAAGGTDGIDVTSPSKRPSPQALLVHERLAEAAAEHAVRQTALAPGSVAWFDRIDLAWRPGPDREDMAALLRTAHRRALGRAATDDEIDALIALWAEVYALEGDEPVLAWSGALSLLLRDPEFVLY